MQKVIYKMLNVETYAAKRRFVPMAAPIKRPVVKKAKSKPNILNNEKKQFPDLSDPEKRVDLGRRYFPYTEKAGFYYTAVAKVAAYLRAHLNCRDVTNSVAGSYSDNETGIKANTKEPDAIYNDVVKNYKKAAANEARYLKITGNDVQVNLAPLVIYVDIAFNEEATAEFSARMKKLFGSFSAPKTVIRDEDNQPTIDLAGQNLNTGYKDLTFYENLKFPKDPAPGNYQPDRLDLGPIEKDVKRAVKIEVKLKTSNIRSMREVGPLNPRSKITFAFEISTLITFPLEYALWLTNATSLTEFVPKLFREQFDTQGRASGKYERRFARTMHIGTVKNLNNQRIKEFGIEVRPRINTENFCILRNGSVYYVPNVDNTDFYVKTLRDSYDPETGLIKHNSQIPELKNKPLLTDWINDVYSYTNADGSPSAQKLNGAIALDDVTINRYLNMPLAKYSEDFLENIPNFGSKVCTEFNLYNNNLTDPAMFAAKQYRYLFNNVLQVGGDFPYAQMVDIAFATDDKANEFSANSRALIREFVRLNSEIASHFMDSTQLALSLKSSYMFYFYLFGNYVKKSKVFAAAVLEERAANEIPVAKDKFELPNSPGLGVILPHMAESATMSGSDNPPKLVALSIAAGGGKTLNLFVDMMLLKQSGKIKVAVVVCPGNLVKEWTSEINRVSQGQVNVIPITTSVVKKMHDHLGMSKLDYIAYLKAAPVNTIFVCSLFFLRLTKDHFTGENLSNLMHYGEKNFINFFPNVQLIRQLNPDYIAIDESHKNKNMNSKTTQAFFALSPVAQYRRIASGTIAVDNPEDIVAQYAILNPAILGSVENFRKNYGVIENNKFVELQPGMDKVLSKVTADYMVNMRKTRPDWAYLLPKIHTQILPCQLTINQAAFYSFLMSEAMKNIRNDEKIKAILAKMDETKQAELEKLLGNHLSRVETFVNAPDVDTVYINKPDLKLKPEDLVSCKVKTVDELLDNHFNVDKSQNKVIIFGVNKVVSRHVFKHTRFQNIAIHYAVSDSLSGVSASQALLKFRNDPKVRILIADATSMREGLNLQTADSVYYLQAEWSPGSEEQAVSRALRPDVPNKYKRKDLYIKKLVAVGTYEIAKTAKLINKMVINRQVEDRDNPDWQNYIKNTPIPSLKPIKMSLELIQDITTFDHPDVVHSIACYRSINTWEQTQFNIKTMELIRKTAKRLGIPEDQVNLRRDALLPCTSPNQLPGSKGVFVPLENGAVPIDKRGLNLIPIAVIKKSETGEDNEEVDDDGDDDEKEIDESKIELEDNTTYRGADAATNYRGDLVQTEYGYGYIKTVLKNQCKMFIPGFTPIGTTTTLSKQVIYKPAAPMRESFTDKDQHTSAYTQWQANVDKLEKDMKKAGPKGITFLEGYQNVGGATVVPTTNLPEPKIKPVVHPSTKPENQTGLIKPPKVEPTPPKPIEKPPKTDNIPKSSKSKLEIIPMVVNGKPALCAYSDEAGFDKLQENHGTWIKVPPFATVHIKTFNGAQRFAQAIQDAGLTIANAKVDPKTKKQPPNQMARMIGLAKKLKGSTDPKLLVRTNAAQFTPFLRDFFSINHQKSPKGTVKMYPIILDDELFMALPITTQQSQSSIIQKLKVPGCGQWQRNKDFAVQFYANPKKAKVALTKIGQAEKVVNYDEAVEDVNHPDYTRLSGY